MKQNSDCVFCRFTRMVIVGGIGAGLGMLFAQKWQVAASESVYVVIAGAFVVLLLTGRWWR